jgi:branched-chain amino acid transport system permease protein
MPARSLALWGTSTVAALAIAGAFMSSYPIYLLSLAMINVISALGLNLLTGNSGQISLCHSSFMAVGAYGASLLTLHVGLPFWAAIPIAAMAAAMLGALLGFPASRLQGIYLALATLGFLQIVQIAIEEGAALTGGVRGLKVPAAALAGAGKLGFYPLFLIVLAVCAFAVWTTTQLLHSRIGREFNAVRASPHAAQALGVSVARVKLVAFSLSAAYAGVAGGLLAVVVGFIDPNEFGVSAALRQITFVVVGGMGSVAGSVLGAAVLSALPEVLRPVKEYSDVIYTIVLLGFLIFVPGGLVTLWRGPRRRPAVAPPDPTPDPPAPRAASAAR